MKAQHFTYILFLYLIVILKYPIGKDNQDRYKFRKYAKTDFDFCPKCFEHQLNECNIIENQIEFSKSFIDSINAIFSTRQTRYGVMRQKPYSPVIIKYLGNDEKFATIQKEISHLSDEKVIIEKLSTMYFDNLQIDGSQFCPKDTIENFLKLLTFNPTERGIWTILNVNIQPLLLPLLNKNGFPVPKILGNCGFTIYETFDGESLENFYQSSFQLKLKISMQLLSGMLKFTEGINGYRFYLTDVTMDNIVYDEKNNRVSFVDLDNVIIVDDSQADPKAINNLKIHRHEMIDCNGCFAYAPLDICAASKSDLNLFSICQFLREDLHKDIKNGFLYPIPDDINNKYPDLMNLLQFCVDCPVDMCENRFDAVVNLIDLIQEILISDEIK